MKTSKQAITGILLLLSVLLWTSCGQQGKNHYQEDLVIENVSTAEYASDTEIDMVEVELSEEPNPPDFNTEEYDRIVENEFKNAKENPLSTFSIDVDKASYTNVRRFIEMGQLPPKNAVRVEELINYFPYNYEEPTGEHPFSIQTELATSPWTEDHLLLKIGLQGKKINYDDVVPSNLVFLIDVSGSMSDKNKLPLLVKSFQLMVNELPSNSRVAIVTYAGNSSVVLPSTSVLEKDEINEALDQLEAGGGTAGAEGIITAYQLAEENLIVEGNNRVILATDGDFNLGTSSTGELVDMIVEKSKKDIYLTICGFGMGNYKDGRMEQISNAGNGNYFYIDNWKESQKVFKKELTANLFTIAKDVKIQIEFNPNTVESYRLIGYENRLLNKEDFNDDTKDAGELGAGHNVTALYEIVPKGGVNSTTKVDDLKYQKTQVVSNQEDLVTVKFRYKPIQSSTSKLMTKTVHAEDVVNFKQASKDMQFASAVASYGMLLRDSEFKGNTDYQKVINWAKPTINNDEYRRDFIQLVELTDDIHVTE
ncbi:MAG: vWA domain-containing protein [Weeksellaceae bacterium]